MKSRFFAVLVVFCMVVCQSSAFSEAEYSEQIVTITQEFGSAAKEERFTLSVFSPGSDKDTALSAADLEYITETIADDTGMVKVSFPFIQVSGAYPYHLQGESGAFSVWDILYYVNQSAYNEAIEELSQVLNGAHENKAQELKQVVEKYMDTLQLAQQFPIYESLKTQNNLSAYERMAKQMTVTMTPEEMRKIFQSSMLLCALETSSAEQTVGILSEYSSVLELTDENVCRYYQNFSESEKVSVAGMIANKEFETVNLFQTEFYRVIALTVFNTSDNWQSLGKGLRELAEIVHIDSGSFFSLSATQQNSALQKVIKQKLFHSLSDFSIKLKAAIADTENSTGGGGGSGGGSRGGGSVSDISMTPDVLEEIRKTPETESERFNDLEDVVWAKEAILGLAELSVISGKGEGVFAPNDVVTREEFVKMLLLAMRFDIGNEAFSAFSDVSGDEWYAPYVATANSIGIAQGNTDGSFGVGAAITRQDAAVMIRRAQKVKGIIPDETAVIKPFTDDEQIDAYAKAAVYELANSGVINGMGDGRFAPIMSITRAESAKMIYAVRG